MLWEGKIASTHIIIRAAVAGVLVSVGVARFVGWWGVACGWVHVAGV